ncbi:hypothetical protein MNBD_GAMMA10-2970, partial [hydrothermal vent metagenome]
MSDVYQTPEANLMNDEAHDADYGSIEKAIN